MVKLKRLLAVMVSVCFAAAALPSASVLADGEKVVTLGADLSDDQKSMILKYFGVEGDTVETLTITNADEREHLGDYVPLEQIGTRTVSCAMVNPTNSGGIQVKTANLTWVTSNMIATTLSTSGVVNCEVLAAAPFAVSGTGALTGIMMAYESASGETLDEDKKDAANRELVTTATIGDHLGQDEATRLVNETKQEVIQNDVTDVDDINDIVNNISVDQNVELTDDDQDLLVSLLEQISGLDYDYDDMQETLDRVGDNVTAQIDGTTDNIVTSGMVSADSILLNTDDTALGDDVNIDATDASAVPETEAPEEPETQAPEDDDSGLQIVISDTYNGEDEDSEEEPETEAPEIETEAEEADTEFDIDAFEMNMGGVIGEETDDDDTDLDGMDSDAEPDSDEGSEEDLGEVDLEGLINDAGPEFDEGEEADAGDADLEDMEGVSDSESDEGSEEDLGIVDLEGMVSNLGPVSYDGEEAGDMAVNIDEAGLEDMESDLGPESGEEEAADTGEPGLEDMESVSDAEPEEGSEEDLGIVDLEGLVGDVFPEEGDDSAESAAEPEDSDLGDLSGEEQPADDQEMEEGMDADESGQPSEASFTVDDLTLNPEYTVNPGSNVLTVSSGHTDLMPGSGSVTVYTEDGSPVETISMDDESKVVSEVGEEEEGFVSDLGDEEEEITFYIYLSEPLSADTSYYAVLSDDAFELPGASLQETDESDWSFSTSSYGVGIMENEWGINIGDEAEGNLYIDYDNVGFAVIDSITLDGEDVSDTTWVSQYEFTDTEPFQITFEEYGEITVHVTFYDSSDSMNYVDEASCTVSVW